MHQFCGGSYVRTVPGYEVNSLNTSESCTIPGCTIPRRIYQDSPGCSDFPCNESTQNNGNPTIPECSQCRVCKPYIYNPSPKPRITTHADDFNVGVNRQSDLPNNKQPHISGVDIHSHNLVSCHASNFYGPPKNCEVPTCTVESRPHYISDAEVCPKREHFSLDKTSLAGQHPWMNYTTNFMNNNHDKKPYDIPHYHPRDVMFKNSGEYNAWSGLRTPTFRYNVESVHRDDLHDDTHHEDNNSEYKHSSSICCRNYPMSCCSSSNGMFCSENGYINNNRHKIDHTMRPRLCCQITDMNEPSSTHHNKMKYNNERHVTPQNGSYCADAQDNSFCFFPQNDRVFNNDDTRFEEFDLNDSNPIYKLFYNTGAVISSQHDRHVAELGGIQHATKNPAKAGQRHSELEILRNIHVLKKLKDIKQNYMMNRPAMKLDENTVNGIRKSYKEAPNVSWNSSYPVLSEKPSVTYSAYRENHHSSDKQSWRTHGHWPPPLVSVNDALSNYNSSSGLSNHIVSKFSEAEANSNSLSVFNINTRNNFNINTSNQSEIPTGNSSPRTSFNTTLGPEPECVYGFNAEADDVANYFITISDDYCYDQLPRGTLNKSPERKDGISSHDTLNIQVSTSSDNVASSSATVTSDFVLNTPELRTPGKDYNRILSEESLYDTIDCFTLPTEKCTGPYDETKTIQTKSIKIEYDANEEANINPSCEVTKNIYQTPEVSRIDAINQKKVIKTEGNYMNTSWPSSSPLLNSSTGNDHQENRKSARTTELNNTSYSLMKSAQMAEESDDDLFIDFLDTDSPAVMSLANFPSESKSELAKMSRSPVDIEIVPNLKYYKEDVENRIGAEEIVPEYVKIKDVFLRFDEYDKLLEQSPKVKLTTLSLEKLGPLCDSVDNRGESEDISAREDDVEIVFSPAEENAYSSRQDFPKVADSNNITSAIQTSANRRNTCEMELAVTQATLSSDQRCIRPRPNLVLSNDLLCPDGDTSHLQKNKGLAKDDDLEKQIHMDAQMDPLEELDAILNDPKLTNDGHSYLASESKSDQCKSDGESILSNSDYSLDGQPWSDDTAYEDNERKTFLIKLRRKNVEASHTCWYSHKKFGMKKRLWRLNCYSDWTISRTRSPKKSRRSLNGRLRWTKERTSPVNTKPSDNRITRSICRACGKCFNNKLRLKIHSLIHSREKPYLCYLCGDKFAKFIDLRAHCLQHSPGESD